MLRKFISISETLTPERVTNGYVYRLWKPYEAQTLPDWLGKSLRDIIEDDTFVSMKIELEHARGETREISLKKFYYSEGNPKPET